MNLQFDRFDRDAFLRDHWQRRPLLIRNPWERWRNPLEPDELAGLACEEGVESRLVMSTGDAWALEHGPLPEARFGRLDERGWTLLVQAVDHHVPEVAALIAPFRFIPDWRIDDVMVSYATEGGGVGPHFDQYDVFLIQGQGRRRWRIGSACDEATELLPHDDLRLLANFTAVEEWILDPGDILYLPPGVSHDGVAVDSGCMTYSIGFRAPSRRELISAWCDEALAGLSDGDRYADPGLALQDNPGEIAGDALDRLQAMVAEKLLDRAAFARWFGAFTSTRRYPDVEWRPDEPLDRADLAAAIGESAGLQRNPASRFAFVEEGEDRVQLFVDGQASACTAETASFAKALCAGGRIEPAPALATSEAALTLIAALYDQGSVAFDQDD